jgi:outer membrane protein OmpA-like peptidoglycan-associated protein
MAQASRLRLLACALVSVFAWLVLQEHAAAQVTLNRYSPAGWNYDGFTLARPERAGHLRFGAQLQLDYAREPLVWLRNLDDPDAGSYEVVSDQLAIHGAISMALFDRVIVSMRLPVNAIVREGRDLPATLGDDFTDFASTGLLSLGARVNLLGTNDSLAAFGVQGGLGFPFGKWLGDATTSFGAETSMVGTLGALLEIRPIPRLRVGASAGVLWRSATRVHNLDFDDELRWVVGGGMMVYDEQQAKVELILEFFGSTVLESFFSKHETPFEMLIGGKVHLPQGWTGGLAADLGMTSGYGSPNYRLIAMFGWTMPGEQKASDRDGDGIVDPDDQCPDQPEDKQAPDPVDGCPLVVNGDKDGDGIADDKDKCVDQPEDLDGFEDDDGCPDPDNDGDGILDAADKCPSDAEDKDGFKDDDGCPDFDNDEDGVLDVNDKCPSEAEDKDGFQDDDGCPDPDNDGDGLLDAADGCPNEAESKNGVDDDDGCPDLVRFAGTQIMTLKPIHFETSSAVIKTDSESILQEMAAVITSHPEIVQLSIDGHTDSKGVPAKNLKLSQDRAESVRTFLVGLGIAPERLVARGYGDTQPIADNATPDGRTKNRRVEFNIMSTSQ